MASSKKNFLIRNLDEPYTKDWIFWLWVISVALALVGNFNNATADTETTYSLMSGVIDAAFVFFANWFVFNWIPRTIRTKLRNRSS
jgi:hypothetical protein